MLIKGDFECVNGPWAGEHLFLSKGVDTGSSHSSVFASTGFFEYKGQVGRYIEDPIEGKLYWEKKSDECPI
jgi:hypothetical protein